MLNTRGRVTGVIFGLLAGDSYSWCTRRRARTPALSRPSTLATPSPRPRRPRKSRWSGRSRRRPRTTAPTSSPRARRCPSSAALADQPEQGGILGFDFYRDPLGAKKPGTTFEEIKKADVAAKPKVMAAQRKLLESRYDLEPKLDPEAKMSRGKPLVRRPDRAAAGGDGLGRSWPP